MSESSWSQVQAINEPAPTSWDDYERGCLLTYRGGHHDEPELAAYQHGMGTVFNLLRAEFPPAEQCKAAPDLLAACKAAVALSDKRLPDDGGFRTPECQEVYDMVSAAITRAEQEQ